MDGCNIIKCKDRQDLFVGTLSSVRSIKANLSKGRDAKPWVYHRAKRGQDSQAAEAYQ
jgi:hypothetical protein